MSVSDVSYSLLGNGSVALSFLEALAHTERVLPRAVILNTPDRQREGTEIRAVCASLEIPVEVWGEDTRRNLMDRGLAGDWILSVYFGHILEAEVLEAYGGRAVNLHPSFLPWNRGANTNVWPIVEGTPAGVTLHQMLPKIDAGPVLFREEEPVHPWDTAASLYQRLEARGLALLLRHWPLDVVRAFPGARQEGLGSFHSRSDMAELESFDLDAHPEARRFFDLLRARTFPPYPGLRVQVDGEVVEALVSLRGAEERS